MPRVGGGRAQQTALRREQILDGAQHLFGTAGYQATSLRTLAKHVGLTHAGILRHYASREDLLHALLDRTRRRDLLDAPTQPPAPASGGVPGTALEHDLRRATEDRGAVEFQATLLGEAAAPEHVAHGYVAERLRALRDRIATAAPGHGTGSDPDQAIDLLAGWDGLLILWLYLPDRASPPEVLAARLARRGHGPVDDSCPEPPPAADPGTVRPSDRPGRTDAIADRAEDILDAAAAAFAQRGYLATSLRSLAEGLGIAHSTLLYYFESKEALLEALLNRRDRDADTAYLTPATVYDRIANVHRRALYNEAHPAPVALYSALLCEATSPTHPAHRYFVTRYTRVLDNLSAELRSLQAQGLVRPDLDPAAEAAWFTALWDGLQVHTPYTPDLGVPNLQIPQHLLRGLNDLLADSLPGDKRSLLLTGQGGQ